MGQTFTARMVARDLSKVLGREVTDKRVRQWVRDHIDAYDDDGYTAHVYDARLRDRIVKGMTERARSARTVAASTGRAGKATPTVKRSSGTRKAPAMGQGPTPRTRKAAPAPAGASEATDAPDA